MVRYSSRRKYGNEPITLYGHKFDSKREANRFLILKDMERRGEIYNLRLQVPYELIPAQTINGKRERAIRYVADFVYVLPDGCEVVEDTKGFRTDVYRLKRKMMKYICGVEVVET